MKFRINTEQRKNFRIFLVTIAAGALLFASTQLLAKDNDFENWGIPATELNPASMQDTLDNPTIHKTARMTVDFSFRHVTLSVGNKESYLIFPKGSSFSIESADERTGLKMAYYSLDGAEERQYLNPVRLNAKGKHIVKVRGLDMDDKEISLDPVEFYVVE